MPSSKRIAKWIQRAHLKGGALHRMLGIPLGQKIPKAMIESAARQGGLLGRRAHAALNLRKIAERRKK